jgi:hypothetical protein
MVGGPIRDLIAGRSTDRGGDSDTILELGVGPNLTLHWLVRWGLPSLINIYSGHLATNIEKQTHTYQNS